MICQEEDRYDDGEVGIETMSTASSSDMEADVQIVNHSDTFSISVANSIEDLVIFDCFYVPSWHPCSYIM